MNPGLNTKYDIFLSINSYFEHHSNNYCGMEKKKSDSFSPQGFKFESI